MAKRGIHGAWSSRWTFILAATGSAVGLGNIWKFPYITGENGGGAFVLVYLACIAVIGIPIMMAETMIGRKGRLSPVHSMQNLAAEAGASRAWIGLGWVGVVAGLLILSFYAVIAGWALNYIFLAASGSFTGASGEVIGGYFDDLLANPKELIMWHSIFIGLTMAIVVGGVTKGLGAAVKVLMPILFVLLILLLIYGANQGEFKQAFVYLFNFKFDALTWGGVQVALGHAFFTLSLGMGAIMAYGAYMPEDAPIGRTVLVVGVLDTLIALVAGLAIFPIVFADPAIEPSQGPGLLFVSLPIAFGGMTGGVIFGTMFFVLVSLAAISSAISLIEPGVAWLVEKGFHRAPANLLLGGIAWAIGLGTVWSFNDWENIRFLVQGPDGFAFFANEAEWLRLSEEAKSIEASISGMTFFDLVDFITANIMLPLGGLFIALFAGWYMKQADVRREFGVESASAFELWHVLVRFISPLLVACVFVMLLWDKFFGS